MSTASAFRFTMAVGRKLSWGQAGRPHDLLGGGPEYLVPTKIKKKCLCNYALRSCGFYVWENLS